MAAAEPFMDSTWYYAEGDKTVGPMSLTDIGAILSHVSNSDLHAWRQYFARMIDLWLFILIFFFVLGIIFPELFETSPNQAKTPGSDYAYSFLGVGAYTIFEAIFLNTFGVTFGKFVYGIQIKMREGRAYCFFAKDRFLFGCEGWDLVSH